MMKRATEEAAKEIAQYRAQREAQFQEYCSKVCFREQLFSRTSIFHTRWIAFFSPFSRSPLGCIDEFLFLFAYELFFF
jgi:hypothetical protein